MPHHSAAVRAAPAPNATKACTRIGLALLLAAALSGCGSLFDASSSEPDNTVGWSAEQLYRDARDEMNSGNWEQARRQLDRIQARYPFGLHAQQAMIDTAYTYWREGSPELALATIERFQQQYPNHQSTDYMLYLKGLITFTPENAFLGNLMGQDPAERDPKGARASFDAFSELVQRYPDSKYADDARQRMTWLLNNIAMNEVHTARYYYERNAYVAAINRAETVIVDFQGTPAAEEALYIMMLSYDRLGMTDLRDDTRRVLVSNFPETRYLEQGFRNPNVKWWNPVTWGNK